MALRAARQTVRSFAFTLLLWLTAIELPAATIFNLSGTVTDSTINGISAGDVWNGVITTDEICSDCFPGFGLLRTSLNFFGTVFEATHDIDYPDFPSFSAIQLTLDYISFVPSKGALEVFSGDREFLFVSPIGGEASGNYLIVPRPPTSAVPEPSTLLMLLGAGAVLGLARKAG